MLRSLIPLALAGLLLAGCAESGGRRRSPAPGPRRDLSQGSRAQVDQEFYKAVSAYSRGDLPAAEAYVTDILQLDPSNKDALDLRRRLRAAESAQK